MQLLSDIKYSLRLLAKTPGFTVATLIVLVAGLSLFITSLSVSRLVTDKPLPFPNGDRYVALKSVDTLTNIDRPTQHDLYSFNRIRNSVDSYSILGAFDNVLFSVSDGEAARQFAGAAISQELLSATQVVPVMGRGFTANDALPDADKVVLIGHSLWQDFYSSSADVVGRTVSINGVTTTIVGVMPEGFNFPRNDNLWIPIADSQAVQPTGEFRLALAGILKPETTHSVAAAELNTIMSQLAEEFPEFYSDRLELVLPYANIADQTRPINFSEIISFITLIVLVLSIVNLSSLLLIRSSARDQELAVRISVGSSPWQLIKQVMLESLLICLLGFVLSLLISSILLAGVVSLFEARSFALWFWIGDLSLDLHVVSQGLIWTLIVWLLSSLVTSLRAYRSQPAQALSINSSKASMDQGNSGTGVVVASEVLLSCFLLLVCGLFTVFGWQLVNTDFGVDPDNYVVGGYSLNTPDYRDSQARLSYIDALNNEVSNAPGIAMASATTAPPGVASVFGTYNLPDRDLRIADQLPRLRTVWIDDNYLEVIGIDVLQGRGFESSDTPTSQQVALINQAFASQLWPDQSPIGKSILSISDGEERILTVVGVIPRLVQNSSDLAPINEIVYRPITQDTPTDFFLIASQQEEMNDNELQQLVIQAGNRVDSFIPINDIRSLAAEIDSRSGGWAMIIAIGVSISTATLILATIGVYAVIARSIALQTQEIGIRRALGSSNSQVIFRFLRRGSYFLLPGVAVGIGVGIVYLVYDDPASIADVVMEYLPGISSFVGLLMASVIVMASYLPAKKAVAMEPGDALRYE